MRFAGLAIVAATLALSATAGRAATYTSVLEYQNGASEISAPSPNAPFGLVTLDEINADTVRVTVTLDNASSLFINTGGPHDPFLFNLEDPGASTPSPTDDDTVTINPATVGNFFDAGRGSFNATPFGTFTNQIGCCTYTADVWNPPHNHIIHHAGDPILGQVGASTGSWCSMSTTPTASPSQAPARPSTW